jgi:uncharacterized protein DUF4159
VSRAVPIALALLLAGSGAVAQFFGGRFDYVRIVPPGSYTGAFLFCRISFRNQIGGDGGGWFVDYPRADENLSFRLSELTTTPIARDANGRIRHIVIRLTDPELSRCPFVMMTEPGGAYFDPLEAAALRNYLLKGGFMWADDFWGSRAWAIWEQEIGKALPASHYPIVELDLSHEIFHALYDVNEKLQVPAIGWWVGSHITSERGYDSAEPHFRAIFDEHRRIMVLMTHNTDFGDAFERETDDREYFEEFAARGYAFGVDALIYAMTH